MFALIIICLSCFKATLLLEIESMLKFVLKYYYVPPSDLIFPVEHLGQLSNAAKDALRNNSNSSAS
jgi:hypothetical protein